ncbi:phosphodiesterase, partial [Pseudomonas syringae pv. tagetis]
YLHANVINYTRLSEVVPSPVWIEQAAGLWVDGFEGEWFSNQVFGDLLLQGKQVCVVSPELPGRDLRRLWQQLLDFRLQDSLT